MSNAERHILNRAHALTYDTRFFVIVCKMKGAELMGMHTLDDLMRKWQREEVTAEQMVGQLLQHISVLYERLRLVERQVGSLSRATPQNGGAHRRAPNAG
jgi:hypothetical protein